MYSGARNAGLSAYVNRCPFSGTSQWSAANLRHDNERKRLPVGTVDRRKIGLESAEARNSSKRVPADDSESAKDVWDPLQN